MKYPNEKKWFARLPIAHRGLHNDDAPENTLAACSAAIDKGYAIEIDVRLSGDNQVVVFHDRELSRLTERKGRVDATDAKELQGLTVKSSSEHIPLLEDVLSLVDDQTPLFLDVKSTFFDAKRDTLALAKALAGYDGRYSVMAFDPRIVAWWTGRRPLIETVQGQKLYHTRLGNGIAGQIFHGNNFIRTFASIMMWKLYGSPGAFFAVPVRALHRRFFQKRREVYEHSPAVPILAWTIKDNDQVKRAKRYADAVIFDGSPTLTL